MQTMSLDLSASGQSGIFGSMESAHRGSVQFTTDGTGSPAGQVDLQGTNEEAPTDGSGAKWFNIKPIVTLAGDAAAVSVGVDFDFPARKYRLNYTKTSGTGTGRVSPVFSRQR